MLTPDDPVRTAFYGVAAFFIAASVAYAANAIAEQVGSNRPIYIAVGYIRHPAARAFVVVLETAVVIVFTQLTFAAATDPTEPSRVNALIYLAAFGVEIFAIIWALARMLRAFRRR